MFKLVLDAGHGLKTSGKRCLKSLDANETREWWLNDRIADEVERRLREYNGCSLLRADDRTGARDVPLAERVKAANKWGADFYLSIHHNAGIKGGSGGGIVAYCHTGAGKASVEWRDELYEALVAHTGLRGNRATPKAKANHYVTRNTIMPSVLLELGFMDSSTDAPILLSDEYAAGCAAAIADVVVRTAGLTKKGEIEVTEAELRAIVREEMAKIEAEKAKLAPAEWAQTGLAFAKSKGITDGTRPQSTATRQEVAVMLYNAMK